MFNGTRLCNFSISPGKKTKVSQIQLQLNRQIESFVSEKFTDWEFKMVYPLQISGRCAKNPNFKKNL
jgi:hypothetical protein